MGGSRLEHRVFRLHLAAIGLLVGAHLLVHALRRVAPDASVYGIWPLVDLNGEHNFPAAFSSLAMLAAAALLLSIARTAGRAGLPHRLAWLLLGGLFAALAVDEWVGLHERLNRPVREALQADGALYFAWVIPYALLLVSLAPLLWRFLLGLERRTRRRFVVAGIVYVTGALLLEMLGASLWRDGGPQTRLYYLETTFEEVLEMVGIALFVRALLVQRRALCIGAAAYEAGARRLPVTARVAGA